MAHYNETRLSARYLFSFNIFCVPANISSTGESIMLKFVNSKFPFSAFSCRFMHSETFVHSDCTLRNLFNLFSDSNEIWIFYLKFSLCSIELWFFIYLLIFSTLTNCANRITLCNTIFSFIRWNVLEKKKKNWSYAS